MHRLRDPLQPVGVRVVSGVVARPCKACGTPLLWLNDHGPTHRPVEQHPAATYPGCEGIVYDRRTRRLRWVSDLPTMPPTANLLHYCTARGRLR